MVEYQNKLTQALAELYQEWDAKLLDKAGGWVMMYRLLRNSIPDFLLVIDNNESLRAEIQHAISKLT